MSISIRPATAGDAEALRVIVRSERLNPTDLDWRRFVLAHRGGTLVGAVQVRRNRDGARELGSLVVLPPMRGQGIAAQLVAAALASTVEEVWMITARAYVARYARWGFVEAERRSAPRSLRVHLAMGRTMGLLMRLRGRVPKDLRLLVRGAPA